MPRTAPSNMGEPLLFGAAYSVYTRIARLALLEKGVAFQFQEIDIFSAAGPPPDYLERHPFGKIPAFSDNGFDLYETAVITRYIDEAFAGPALQPTDVKTRARMAQIVGLLDSYGYKAMVWDVFVERVRRTSQGHSADEAKISDGLARAELCFEAIEEIMGDRPFFAGEQISLADLHAAPMIACLRVAPEGRARLDARPRLNAWWKHMVARSSMRATPSPMFDDATARAAL